MQYSEKLSESDYTKALRVYACQREIKKRHELKLKNPRKYKQMKAKWAKNRNKSYHSNPMYRIRTRYHARKSDRKKMQARIVELHSQLSKDPNSIILQRKLENSIQALINLNIRIETLELELCKK